MVSYRLSWIKKNWPLLPRRLLIILVLGITVGSCAVAPKPLTPEDRKRQIVFDLAELFARPKPPEDPITLYQAMSYALHFNLSHRVNVMEEVLSRGMDRVVSQSMLPRLVADAGYINQDRLSPLSNQLSNQTGDLAISWNILDFGVSYLSAKQQGDRTLIAEELRRKSAHILIQEVRTTFWQAIAAERLNTTIAPLKKKLQEALVSAHEAEEARIESPIPLLDFQVVLLETLQKLQKLEQELSGSRVKLAELMGLDPGYPFALVEPKEVNLINFDRLPPIETLEHYALQHRPELWERDYQRRIKAYETRKALLRLLPGLELSQSQKYDDTESNANSVWSEFGVKLTWNILNLLTAPDNISLAHDRERMEDFRRLALNMAVMAQVHIALRNVIESNEAFAITSRLNEVKERLRHHSQAAQQAETLSELQRISREGEHIIFLTRRDLAFAQLQNAVGAFFLSLGVDSVPGVEDALDTDRLELLLTESDQRFNTGSIPDLAPAISTTKQSPKTVMGRKDLPGAVSTEWVVKKSQDITDPKPLVDRPPP